VKRWFLLVGLMPLVSACAYTVSAPVSAAYEVYSSYSEQVPGRYALLISSDSLSSIVRPSGVTCAAYTYPVDANEAFESSIVGTFEQLFEDVEVVDIAVPREKLAERGFDGQIVVRSNDFRPRIRFVPGFFSATAVASVDISANISIDGAQDRLFGTSVGANRSAEGESGTFCGNGSEVLGEATGQSMRELMERMGERIANAPKLRQTDPT
jgi:hypothetical protein